MAMRLLSLICGAALLGACATSPQSQVSSSDLSEGPRSQLAPGQCGMFGWSTDAAREFIFYADETSARYDSFKGPIDLTAQTAFPSTDYQDMSGNSVTLRLGEGEVMNGGMRYPGARVVTLTDEGWERLHPVAIVRTCQPA